jgi:hypothetical protein
VYSDVDGNQYQIVHPTLLVALVTAYMEVTIPGIVITLLTMIYRIPR